jgi:4-amino-4-deoxy-L-arabinose transferase-like glycosyltransferase
MGSATTSGALARATRPAASADMARWTAVAGIGPVVVVLLGGLCLLVRAGTALTPVLRETYYDEALTGLMSLQILRGIPQVFYWGQPYLGAVDAYLAAAAFRVFGPSTLALRLGTAWLSVLWVWAAWRIARRMAGEKWGVFAGLEIALPPVFLTYLQLSSHAEGVALALGMVTLATATRLVDIGRQRPEPWRAWVVLGVAAGLAWWTSQMASMLLGAAAAGLLVARPGVLRRPWPYVALGLFTLASLPFWVWNARHEWATFRHLASWGEPLPGPAGRVLNLTGTIQQSLLGGYWDSHAIPLPGWVELLGWTLLWAVYVPAAALAAWRVGLWIGRVARRERPWREPLDLVALAFWLTVVAHLVTWFGTSGVLRYALTFYGPLPLLATAFLARLAHLGRLGRAAAIALAGGLLVFNLATHVQFARAGARAPVRPVDAAIGRLEALGIRGCYADSRIAQVLAFESAERVSCADFLGLRNFAYLQAVDRIEDPAAVAIVTHETLRNPPPAPMARALARIGARAETTQVGQYVIFHHAVPPDVPLQPIPVTGWRARASADADDAGEAFDRRVWTRWTAPKHRGQWYELDLGHVRPVAGVSLLTAPWTGDAPTGLQVDVSADGRHWVTVLADEALLPGLHWWKGHPRVDDSGRVLVRFPRRPSRYLRFTHIGAETEGGLWGIAELFVYEAGDAPWHPARPAVDALQAAGEALDHWMDDPGGPHPRRAPVTYEHRRAQVPWAAALGALNRALDAAPDWEEAHHLYGRALSLSGWGDAFDRRVDRAREDGAWIEVTRWATVAEEKSPLAWRAGRVAAWAEALERLGRPAEAVTLRAQPAPVPSRPTRVRFGPNLELVGLDIPDEVRPGGNAVIRYHWRLVGASGHDPWVFLHVRGLPGGGNFDQPVGGTGYPTSVWPRGERLVQAVPVAVPPDARPGRYPMSLGVWLPLTGLRFRIVDSDLPPHHRAVEVGALTVVP